MYQITFLRQRLLLIVLFGVVAATMLSTLASDASVPDLSAFFENVSAVMRARLALLQGQFPLRDVVNSVSDWHYPFFQFNAPTSYTLAGFICRFLTPSNPYLALKLTVWCALVCGGIYIYRLTCCMALPRAAGILAGITYLTAPYYSIVISHFGEFSEAIALGVLPAVIYYTLQRYREPTANITLLQTALAWYVLATIHVITFFYASFFVGLWLVMLTARQPRHFINLLDTLLAYAFGCLLAMWYLGPVFVLQNYFTVDNQAPSAEAFTTFHPYLANLLAPTLSHLSKIMSGGEIGLLGLLHPNLGYPLLFALIVSIYRFFTMKTTEAPATNQWQGPLLVLFLIALVMVWSPVNIWRWLPSEFWIGLYSWRLLGQVMWIGALLFGGAISWFFDNKMDARHVVLGAFFILTATSMSLAIPERSFVDLKTRELTRAHNHKFLLSPQKNVLTINAIDSVNLKSSQRGGGIYLDPAKTQGVKQTELHCHSAAGTTLCRFTVPAAVNLVELPVLYYPDMLDITVNGKPVDYSNVLYQRYIMAAIIPQAGVNDVSIRFRGLPWANSLSGASWGLWGIFLIFVALKAVTRKSATPVSSIRRAVYVKET